MTTFEEVMAIPAADPGVVNRDVAWAELTEAWKRVLRG